MFFLSGQAVTFLMQGVNNAFDQKVDTLACMILCLQCRCIGTHLLDPRVRNYASPHMRCSVSDMGNKVKITTFPPTL